MKELANTQMNWMSLRRRPMKMLRGTTG